MKPHRRVFVVGGAHTPFRGRSHPDFVWHGHPDHGTRTNPTLEQLLHQAILGALDATGVPAAAIDKGYVANFLGECFAKQGHLGAMAPAAHPDLEGTPFARIEAACASGAAAVSACVESMQAGADLTLAAGVEVENTVRGRDGVEYMAYAAHMEKQRHLEFALFPWLFARRARGYKEAFGATDTDLARVVVKAYANARRNPLALNSHVPVSLDDAVAVSEHNRLFLDDPELREHIKLLDCTAFTDGASAAVLATEAGLQRLGIDLESCTEILGIGHTTRALDAETDPARMVNIAHAARIAYEAAAIGPDDIELAEVHDCFSIAELQMTEALGLAPEGEAPRLLSEGHTAIDGRVPVNPGGGLLGFGHPIGATGIKQVVEVWRQARRMCGDYQVPGRPRHAVTANLGGDDRTAVVMVHRMPGA